AFPGTGIGIAGVDDQSPDALSCRQVGLADLNRRSAEAVAGEYPGNAAAVGQAKNRQVAVVGLAYAGSGDADFNAGNGLDAGFRWNVKVDGHGVVSARVSDETLILS